MIENIGTPTDDDAILPDDYAPDATPAAEATPLTSPADGKQTDTTPAAKTEEGKPEVRKMKVKFLQEEKELTEDEAIPLIQKGMNYDHLHEKATAAETKLQRIATTAKALGFSSVDAYMESLDQQTLKGEVEAELAKMDVPPELRDQMEKIVLENIKLKRAESEKGTKERKASETKARQDAEYQAFFSFAEKEGVNTAPDEIIKTPWWQEHKASGKPIMEAFRDWERAELKRELSVLKQNDKNKGKAPISTTQQTPTEQESDDPFLKGFNVG